MPDTAPRHKGHTLQQVASAVFALIAILPLLTFAYVLYSVNAIEKFQYQASLVLALMVALVGFLLFRIMVSRMSRLLRVMGEAAVRGEFPEVPAERELEIPGIGPIEEFQELSELVEHLAAIWKGETEPLLDQRVLVLQRGSPHPIHGTLARITEDGILLDIDGRYVPVHFRRLMAIEAEPGGAVAAQSSRTAIPRG